MCTHRTYPNECRHGFNLLTQWRFVGSPPTNASGFLFSRRRARNRVTTGRSRITSRDQAFFLRQAVGLGIFGAVAFNPIGQGFLEGFIVQSFSVFSSGHPSNFFFDSMLSIFFEPLTRRRDQFFFALGMKATTAWKGRGGGALSCHNPFTEISGPPACHGGMTRFHICSVGRGWTRPVWEPWCPLSPINLQRYPSHRWIRP